MTHTDVQPLDYGTPPTRTRRSITAGLLNRSSFLSVWVLTIALFLGSALFVHGTVGSTALHAMLPFAAILALAAAGQTLVVQQGGIDLSSAGVVSLSCVLVVQVSGGSNSRLLLGIVLALVAAAITGFISGIVITRLGVTPFVATLAMNALLTGTVLKITGGNMSSSTPSGLSDFAGHRLLGLQMAVWVPILLILVLAIVLRRSVVGRRFEVIGAGPAAARAMGLPVRRYEVGAYVGAALCYALAGVLLAGFLGRPGVFQGDPYLLSTIAAVAIGGTALGGGRGSVVASAIGALFLTQLSQVALASGTPSSVQNLIQGAVIIVGIGLRGHSGWTNLNRLVPRALIPAGRRQAHESS